MNSVARSLRRAACGAVASFLIAWLPLAHVLAAPARAQHATGTIEGVVRTRAEGAPAGVVSVFIPALRRGTTTDAAGRFRINGVPAGEHRIVAQRVGLTSDSLAVTVAAGGVSAAHFTLGASATVVAPVVVSATRELQRRTEGSVAIDALDGLEIRETRASHPAGILNRLAGVHVSELSGEGHSMAIRQPITTKPMYLYLEDGVPTRPTGFFNHNALYEVNLPQAGGLEIVKGPGTALYGSDAIGGVVNVFTRPAPLSAELEVNLEGGAHGYRRALATGGFTHGGHGLRADLNVTHGDNWKDAAPFDRLSGTLRWDAVPGASGWSARTTLAGARIDQQDVPAIPRATFDTAMRVNLAPIAFRRVRTLRAASAIEREAGRTLWSVTPFARVNVMELLPSWQLTYDPQIWTTRNVSGGVLLKVRRELVPLQARIIAGADADVSPGSFTAVQAVVSSRAPWTSYTEGSTHYDFDVTYRQLSPYVHLELTPLPRMRLDAGLRADFSGYVYATHLPPLQTGAHRRPADTTVSHRHLSPKLGVSYELNPRAAVFASYRHGFRAPSQGQLFQQNSAANTVGLDPVQVDSYEAGVRGQLTQRVVYQVAAYDMLIRNDIVTYQTPQNTREATNAGRTRHRGIESSVGIALVPTLRADAAWSVATHRYVEWNPSSTVSYGGMDIEQAPGDLGSVMLAWTPSPLNGGRFAVEWSHTGPYATDPANTKRYGGHDLVNLHASARLRRAQVFARLINVADRRYAELVAYDRFAGEQFTPGAPRSLFAGVAYAF